MWHGVHYSQSLRNQLPCFWGEILPKNEINFLKIGDLGGFHLLEVRIFFFHINILGFHYVTKNNEG
jgi:hypothetical protein